jgi:hypothetical protein
MACLVVGVFLQVVLILVLSLPEPAGGLDLGDDLAGPQAGRVGIGDRVLGDLLLLIAGLKDRGAVIGADVVHLAVDRRRIVDLKEELEDVAERGLLRVEDDLDRLRVGPRTGLGRIGNVPARPTCAWRSRHAACA